jgi:exodeoxyribonuclease VII large subunit
MQGARADADVAVALRTLAARRVDLVALVRGGGSRIDLATFDTERVARTIATLDVPVFTGIGHEVDRSVADDVAHTAFKTPTACAVALCTQVRSYRERTEQLHGAIARHSVRLLDQHDRRLRSVAEHCARATRGALSVNAVRIDHLGDRLVREADLVLTRSRSHVDRAEGRVVADAARHLRAADAVLDDAVDRLRNRPARTLAGAERRLDALAAHARALDPVRVLARGWSITRRADGTVVRSVADVDAGTEVVTTVADGTIRSTVTAAPAETEQD